MQMIFKAVISDLAWLIGQLFCVLCHGTLSDSVNTESKDGLVRTDELQMAWKEDTV
jgi:hypothetical protein